MRIRVLEEQNEKLSAYATRVKAEIDELKRVINRYH
jgi:molecular chaperone GrpE (heat shock protein)